MKLQTIPVKYQEILEKKSGDPDQISGNLGKILGNLGHIIDPINYVMLFSSFPLTKEMRLFEQSLFKSSHVVIYG